MKTIATDIDTERPNDGEHYTVYFRQGELAGNMLLPQEAIEKGKGIMEAAQAYLDAHAEEVPQLVDFPNLAEAGAVTKYLVEESQDSCSGMVFIENDSEEISSLIEELRERDSSIQTYDDVMKSLEADFQKFPAIRDYIEYSSPDDYIPSGEPLLYSYTGLASAFASTVAMTRERETYGKAMEMLPKMRQARERLDTMYQTAETIHTASSDMANQFMQVYWETYNSPNMTNKDDHEAACCKAIRHCMDKGATQSL